jgi:hypothetical protein
MSSSAHRSNSQRVPVGTPAPLLWYAHRMSLRRRVLGLGLLIAGIALVLWWRPVRFGFVQHPLEKGRDFILGDASHLGPMNKPSISIETRFLSFDASTPDALPRVPVLDRLLRENGEIPLTIDDSDVNLLIRATQASVNSTTLTAPRLTTGHGQPAYCVIGSQQAYIQRVELSSGGNLPFQPHVATAHSGLSFRMLPTIMPGGSSVRVNARLRFAKLEQLVRIPYPETLPGATDEVQIPKGTQQTLEREFSAANGRTMMLLGLRADELDGVIPMSSAKAARNPKNLTLILIKATIVPAPTTKPAAGELRRAP